MYSLLLVELISPYSWVTLHHHSHLCRVHTVLTYMLYELLISQSSNYRLHYTENDSYENTNLIKFLKSLKHSCLLFDFKACIAHVLSLFVCM